MHIFPFNQVNLYSTPLQSVRAHGGEKEIQMARVLSAGQATKACHFIDIAELPPGASIGFHTHHPDEEEFYLILSGSGVMMRDSMEISVTAGDLIRTPPGGSHGLINTGEVPLRIFVFELAVQS